MSAAQRVRTQPPVELCLDACTYQAKESKMKGTGLIALVSKVVSLKTGCQQGKIPTYTALRHA